jgi:hypothetical protein
MSPESGELFRTSLHKLPHTVASQELRSLSREYRPDAGSLIDDLLLIMRRGLPQCMESTAVPFCVAIRAEIMKRRVPEPVTLIRGEWLTQQECECMNRLVEIRSQEFLCRERAALDSERWVFWLAQAQEWEQRALDEIAYHFRECNLARAGLNAA